MTARIVGVGRGPGDPGLVTASTIDALARVGTRFVRTRRHPSAGLVGEATSFDGHYDDGDTFDAVYARIVADLIAAAEETSDDEILYAVPGSPRVLERTVDLLVEAAIAGRAEVEVLGAVSFLDLVWASVGTDPFAHGVRLIDGHRFAEQAAGERGPLLVAHCHNKRVLSDVKLAVDDPPTEPVTVLQRLGSVDQAVFDVAWSELDRSFEPDHLTALWIPQLVAPVAGEVQRFVELVARLRAECPWDREQTHASLTRHLLEESYEVLEALAALDESTGAGYDLLEEELGDLLFQIVFHSTLASEQGAFTLADVARGVHDKLVRRHPHVFGTVEVAGSADVVTNWEQIKKAEKGRASVFEGIPPELPALLHALKVQKKAAGLGLTPAVIAPPLADAVDRLGPEPDTEAIGRLLMAGVGVARACDIDPEAALRAAALRLRDAAQAVERLTVASD
ncbi:MAG: MazG family protein [Actinomycetota bacterium]|nr:MazG family protein [Actinomycetota bacterium]